MEYASLQWNDDGTPSSTAHGDVYFSREGARAETELVFLEGNDLPQRWQDSPHFTIAETGFGTGLNFLHALDRFAQTAPTDARLHYISVEKAPLSPADLARAHALWPELEAHSAALRRSYPPPVAGWHRIHLPRATLTLGFGDATALLQSIDARVDAWFLDGFAPAKNADMWQETLLHEIVRLSAPRATLASFTAAGAVRRSLEALGFAIERRPGYANKRHRIAGWRTDTAAPTHHIPPDCLVIGAGIAGAATASALAQRGVRVTLLDAAEGPASGASGNRAGVLYPQITKHATPASRFGLAAFAHTRRLLAQHGTPHASPGMLKTPKDAKENERLRTLPWHPDIAHHCEQAEASSLLGVPLPSGGLWFPQGTWLNPQALVAALLAHPYITSHYGHAVMALERTPQGWRAITHAGRFEASHAVLANAAGASQLYPGLPMGISAGQVSYVPRTQASAPLAAILCHKGYIVPQADTYLVGATYDHHDHSGAETQANHAKNHAEAEAALPGWLAPGTEHWQGRTSLRAATPDRLPYIGRLEEGLYANLGHGSRGLLSGPLGGECVASMIVGECVPLERDLLAALCPKRRQL